MIIPSHASPRALGYGVMTVVGRLIGGALANPKVTAVALGIFMMSDKTFGAEGLIISLPCYVACLATGALAGPCIAFCTLLP